MYGTLFVMTTDAPEPDPMATEVEFLAIMAETFTPEPKPAPPAGLSAGRKLAVFAVFAVTLIVVGAAFALSFDAIKDMGKLAGIRSSIAWLLPVCIDGAMIVGTASWQWKLIQRRQWKLLLYPAAVVLIGAAVSVALNAAHAQLHHAPTLDQAAAMFVAALPAVFLAGSVHLVADLIQDIAPRERSLEPLPQVSVPVSAHDDMPVMSGIMSGIMSGERPPTQRKRERTASAKGGPSAAQVKWMRERLTHGQPLTGPLVAEKFAVSEPTARRWIAALKESTKK